MKDSIVGGVLVLPSILFAVWCAYVILDAKRRWWSRILLGLALLIASLATGLGAMWMLDLMGLAEFSGGPL